MQQNIYNTLKEYLKQNGELEVDKLKEKNVFDVNLKGTEAGCGIRIRKAQTDCPHIVIQGYYGGNEARSRRMFYHGYSVISKITTQQGNYPFSILKKELPCEYNDKGDLLFPRKSISIFIGEIELPVNALDKKEEKLKEIEEASTTLINIYKACSELQPKRKFINIDEDKEVSRDRLQTYLKDKLTEDEQKQLLDHAKMGITYPSGKVKANYKARLWVDERYLNEHPETFPKEDISKSYWTETWKPPFEANNQESSQYWLLVKDSVTYNFKSYEKDATFNISIKNNKPAKTAKVGDVVLCYSMEDQAIIARAEIVEVQKNKSIVLKINEHISPVILRDLILQQDKLDFFDDNLFTATESTIETALISLNIEQFNIINQIMSKAKPHNRILFGAPGTGKSFKLKQDVEAFYGEDKTLEEACTERVTFHPEYSYFDFVGSYKPVMTAKKDTSKQKGEGETNEAPDKEQQGEIIYDFVPGPFARVLKNALDEKKLDKNEGIKDFVLIIEEINRAKVAAVFGDIFQLLDRNEEGESEYGINPSKEFREFLKLPEGEKLKLPDNMYIWATMNSADQGVYPMDTAFKRRWSFKYTDIDDGAKQMQGAPYHEDWEKLRRHVNELLQKEGINEDKQMGPFFLKKSELQDPTTFKNAIQNKVLMYLFEDAAKHKRKKIFKEPNEGMRYSAICKIFSKIYTKKEEGKGSECNTMADILEKLFNSTK